MGRRIVHPTAAAVYCEACGDRIEVGQAVFQTVQRTVCALCVTDEELAQVIGATLS